MPNPGFSQSAPPAELSFWKKLFELEFRHFITPSVVKILYILWIIGASIYGLIILIAGLAALGDSDGASIIFVLIAPIAWLVMIVYGRVLIEVFIALIRTAQNTTTLVELQGGTPPGGRAQQGPTTF